MNIKPLYQKILAGVFLIVCILSIHNLSLKPLHAATTPQYTLLEPLPCIPSTDPENPVDCKDGEMKTEIDITTYVNYIFRLSIALAAFLAVLMFTIGGFEYMTSEAVGSKKDAKDRMWNSVLGLLAALVSYVILYTIDPRLVQINANIEPLSIENVDIFADFDKELTKYMNELDNWRRFAKDRIVENHEIILKAQSLREKVKEIDALLLQDSGAYKTLTDAKRTELETKREQLIKEANSLDDEATIRSFTDGQRERVRQAVSSVGLSEEQVIQNVDKLIQEFTKGSKISLTSLESQLIDKVGSKKMVEEIYKPETELSMNTLYNRKDVSELRSVYDQKEILFDKEKTRLLAAIQSRHTSIMNNPKASDDVKRRAAIELQSALAAINAVQNLPKTATDDMRD